jgi:hypothetical protein
MAAAFVKSAKGSSTSATVSWAFGSATTSGNLIVGVIAADDYTGSPDSGWTLSSEMNQEGYHGAYLWWRISTGETSPQSYSLNGAANSAWMLMEFSGIDATPYDTSQGLITNTGDFSYATDSLTPTSGNRLIVATHGASHSGSLDGQTVDTWTNSFTHIDSIGTTLNPIANLIGCCYRVVAANGSTAYSTAGTYSYINESRSALIIAFKEGAGGGSIVPRAMAQYINQVIS